MMSMSLWAHLASLVAFLGAGYLALRWQRQRLLLAELLGYPAKVKVDWPMAYLRGVCRALNIEFDDSHLHGKGQPSKIDVGKLSEFFRRNRVVKISAEPMDGIINVRVLMQPKSKAVSPELLSQAFQDEISVSIQA